MHIERFLCRIWGGIDDTPIVICFRSNDYCIMYVQNDASLALRRATRKIVLLLITGIPDVDFATQPVQIHSAHDVALSHGT